MVSLLLSSPKTSLTWADRFPVSGTSQFPPAADSPSSLCSNLLSFSPAGPGAVRGRAPRSSSRSGDLGSGGELLQVGAILVLGEPLQVRVISVLGEPQVGVTSVLEWPWLETPGASRAQEHAATPTRSSDPDTQLAEQTVSNVCLTLI